MVRKIELHDSKIESIAAAGNRVDINFATLVTIELKDKFGFDFGNHLYKKGIITIHNPKYEKLPANDYLSDRKIVTENVTYELIPIGLNLNEDCVLVLNQGAQTYLIFGSRIEIKVQN